MEHQVINCAHSKEQIELMVTNSGSMSTIIATDHLLIWVAAFPRFWIMSVTYPQLETCSLTSSSGYNHFPMRQYQISLTYAELY